MYFLTYFLDNHEKIGVLNKSKNKVIELSTILGDAVLKKMVEFIPYCNEEIIKKINNYLEEAGESQGIAINSIKIASPIPEPIRNVICLGLNYKDHAEELKGALGDQAKTPEAPIYFGKMAPCIIGQNDEINPHLGVTEEIDYEVELAVIIGKKGVNIAEEEVEEYIFGYTILNDISARDLQKKHNQWIKGKSLDTFTAMGPYIVHKSQLPLPLELNLECKVNGEIRQNSNTRNLIFDIPHIISDLSRGTTLKPGDIIATGTPAGVAMGFNTYEYLKTGDTVACSIEGIGTLINRIGG